VIIKKIFKTKVLDSRAVILKSNGNYCMCMTSSGHVYVWKYAQETPNQDVASYKINRSITGNKNVNDDLNLQNLTTIINRESCQFILKNGEWLDSEITEAGVPIISMSKNRSYFFSLKTKSWHLLPCLGTNVGQDSQLWFNSNTVHANSKSSNNNSNNANIINGPLNQIQSRNKNSNILKTIETLNKTTVNNGVFNKQDFTLTHLESQVNAAIGLNSAKEYKFWLMTLVRYLVENNYEEKLKEICNFLLGPRFSVNWNHTFLTYNKRDLLKEVNLIIGGNLSLQRVYSFYKQQLDVINELNSKNSFLEKLVSSNRLETDSRHTNLPTGRVSSSSLLLEAATQPKDTHKAISLDEEKEEELKEVNPETDMQIENEDVPVEANSKEINTVFKMPDIPVQGDLRSEMAVEEIQTQQEQSDALVTNVNGEHFSNDNNIDLKS